MKIKNSFSYKKNGWTYISVKGKPRERGYAYGYHCADEFKKIQDMLKFYIFESYGDTWDNFIVKINKDIKCGYYQVNIISYYNLFTKKID